MTATPTPPAAARFRLRRLDLAADDPTTTATVRRLVRRGAVFDPDVRDLVHEILDDVRLTGSLAVQAAASRFGGGPADRLLIDRQELAAAADRLPRVIRDALEQAIGNVRRFAESQRPASTRTTIAPGIEIERRWSPLARVGAYVPGGSAPYPSTLVMTSVPAMVAGVRDVVVASPARGADGEVDEVLLGAAGILGVGSLLVAGGAQAIGALAHGLPDIGFAPVDRIVGPGNAWVTAAKIEVSAVVGIDLPAGPSEGMVIADSRADPILVAADLVTQAEHGPDSPAILVTVDAGLADAVEVEIAALLPSLERRSILESALRDHGWIVFAPDLDSAIAFANEYAPEHLSVDVTDPEGAVERLTSAGSIFVGPWAPESAGDYATGANHVLPTGGLARSCGPLAVETFGRFSQVQRIDREGLRGIADTIRVLATAEGLTAHRNAVDARFDVRRRSATPEAAR